MPILAQHSECICLFLVFRYYGQLSVPADKKWDDIFHHCCSALGHDGSGRTNTSKAWEMVAVAVSSGKKQIKEMQKMFVIHFGLCKGNNLSYPA